MIILQPNFRRIMMHDNKIIDIRHFCIPGIVRKNLCIWEDKEIISL